MQIPVNALESSDEEGKILAFARRTLSNETDKTESHFSKLLVLTEWGRSAKCGMNFKGKKTLARKYSNCCR